MRIWKLCYMDETTIDMDVFDSIELLTDISLKERFKKAIENGQLCEETIEKYKLDANKNYDIGTIVRMFKADGYIIASAKIQTEESGEIQTEPKRYCPHCNKEVIPSKIVGYAWQCLNCDEDFYEFEVRKEY